jgi:hypothetical protein
MMAASILQARLGTLLKLKVALILQQQSKNGLCMPSGFSSI